MDCPDGDDPAVGQGAPLCPFLDISGNEAHHGRSFIYHWKKRRVQAHVAICFAAFALLRILRHRYNTRYGSKYRLSEGRILAELGNVEAAMICDRGNHAEYLLPSKPAEEGIRLY